MIKFCATCKLIVLSGFHFLIKYDMPPSDGEEEIGGYMTAGIKDL